MLEVYWGSGSPYAWRVLLALAVKRQRYASELLEFSKKEHQKPEYLALNPRGKVPTIKDGDFVLTESIAILVYLDRKFPDPPLFGRTPEETGRSWRQISEALYYLEPAASRVIRPIFVGKVAEKADDIGAAINDVHAELKVLEDRLRAADWLAGGSLSAADIAVHPFLELLLRAAGKDIAAPLSLGLLPLERTYPAIARWRERITALPGYDRTYPPHWRQTPPQRAAS